MASTCPKCKVGKIRSRKCNKCGQKPPRSKKQPTGTFDRWANGAQYGSYNSDED